MLHRCGYDIVRCKVAASDSDKSIAIRKMRILRGLNIDLIFDVGASDGSYSRELRDAGYKGKIISFEPMEAAFNALRASSENDPLWQCERAAVGECAGEKDLHIARNMTSSSLLPMLDRHAAVCPDSVYIGKEPVRVITLDSLGGKIAEYRSVYLKADVQGYEKNVLEGAHTILNKVQAVEIELSLVPLYEKGPMYTEMIAYLERLGYHMVSWEDVFVDKRNGHLLQSNAIFVRA